MITGKKKESAMFPRTGIEPVTFRLYDDPLQPNVISNYTIEGLIAIESSENGYMTL